MKVNQIYFDKHLNMDALIMENKYLQIKTLPKLGFKIASIIYKPKDKEFLFQPTKEKYHLPNYGDSFERYDTSGLDEMLPTIDKCKYPGHEFRERILPDHGDVWSLPWNVEVLNNEIIGNVKLRSLPLGFTKSISFKDENTIRMDYQVKNLSNEDIYYIWALHGLNVFDNDTSFIFQNDMINPFNVQDNEDLNRFDFHDLKNYGDGKTYKFYFPNEITRGQVGLNYKKDKIKYMIKYDSEILPYLGVWITKGGFKGEYNCALEPSNGFYDSVDLAYKNKKIPLLKENEKDKWTIYIEIKEY